ncbi:S-phase kinase-associated protein 2 isoform X1 [Hydra vulgaris]|uniref:S-phase kinase-associated protein 2 n=1 Tax=Hydra vulgaris TaxID=6087 RepID=T2MDR0_HYDVU|nr:S-phase kinase-associated protein 2 [Hydra vulgaris]
MLAKKMAAIPHRWGGERKNSFFLSSKKTDTVVRNSEDVDVEKCLRDNKLRSSGESGVCKEQGEDISNFLLLSDEIIIRIFSYLPINSLTKAARVNKRWKTLTHDSELWHSVNLDNCRFKKEGMLGSLLHRGVAVLRLSKAEILAPICYTDEEDECKDFDLKYLDASMTQFSQNTLFDLLIKCVSLVNLSLEGCKAGVLEVAAISNNKRLQVLNLSMAVGVTLSSINILTKQCRRLESLNLAWTNQTRDCIRFLCRLSELKELNLSGLRGGINRKAMECLVMACKKLRALDLSDVTLQIGIMKLIADNCILLEELSISRCSDVKPEQLLELTTLDSLCQLNLFGFVNSAALERFANLRSDVAINKSSFSPIARPICTTSYEGKIWEEYAGFII